MRCKWKGGAASVLALAGIWAAQAAAADPWLVRVGIHNVDPASDSGTLAGGDATVDSAVGPTFNIDYFFTPNLALDVLAALPFEHDISINGTKVGSTRQLPPTVSVQYHFMPDAAFDPFVGAGINYTLFMSEKLDGGGELELDPSFGFAVQLGVDYAFAREWVVGADVRYISIESDAAVNGTDVGTAEINPLAYGVTVGRRF